MKPDRKQISTALIEHLEREEFHSGQAAAYLNLNPYYISMAKSEKSWNSMSNTAWARLEEWFNTRENIKDFVIPEGEEIWKKPERDPSTRITEPNVPKARKQKEEPDEHSPANLTPPEFPADRVISHKNLTKKEMPGKSVQLIINNARLEAIDKWIADMKEENKKLLKGLQESEHYYELLKDNYDRLAKEQFVLIDETIPVILSRIESLQKPSGIISIPEEKSSKGIVIFQRNYYSK